MSSSLLNNLPSYSSDSFRELDDAQLPVPPPQPPKRYTASTKTQHVKSQPIKREKVNCLIRALANNNSTVRRMNSNSEAGGGGGGRGGGGGGGGGGSSGSSDGAGRASKRPRLQRPPSLNSL